MIAVCRYCGCTENSPCVLPEALRLAPELLTCSWLLEDVCTAPQCVAKAYAEAVVIVEHVYAQREKLVEAV